MTLLCWTRRMRTTTLSGREQLSSGNLPEGNKTKGFERVRVVPSLSLVMGVIGDCVTIYE